MCISIPHLFNSRRGFTRSGLNQQRFLSRLSFGPAVVHDRRLEYPRWFVPPETSIPSCSSSAWDNCGNELASEQLALSWAKIKAIGYPSVIPVSIGDRP